MISSTRVSRIDNGAQCATMRASYPGGSLNYARTGLRKGKQSTGLKITPLGVSRFRSNPVRVSGAAAVDGDVLLRFRL
jgi:hypothetical protein